MQYNVILYWKGVQLFWNSSLSPAEPNWESHDNNLVEAAGWPFHIENILTSESPKGQHLYKYCHEIYGQGMR